jgi:predicted enzyme related to lactoylglutathione lyase
MQVNGFILNITSDQPEELRRFYREVVCLPAAPGVSENAFRVGGGFFSVDGHSEVHGQAKEPQRHLINFLVDDLTTEQARLEAQGVPFIRRSGAQVWDTGPGAAISTFLDPDGNFCQLIELRR